LRRECRYVRPTLSRTWCTSASRSDHTSYLAAESVACQKPVDGFYTESRSATCNAPLLCRHHTGVL